MQPKPLRRFRRALLLGSFVAGLMASGLLALPVVGSAMAQSEVAVEVSRAPIPDQYIVVFRDDVADPEGLTQELQIFHGFQVGNHYGAVLKGFSGTMSPGIARALAAHPDVASVSPNLRAYASAQTVPTGVLRIEADLNPIDASSVVVAVVDTGIDLDHPQLNVQAGYNFLVDAGCAAPNSPGDDDNSHGTHVAGTIGAYDDNDNVVGVAPGVQLLSYKVLCANGTGTFSDIIAAIEHITLNASQIEVVNMSLSGIGHLPALQMDQHPLH